MNLSPIVLFVYNRPLHTEQTLNALMQNVLAEQSILYIYSDGAKVNASEEELNKIKEVRNIIRKKKWCKEVHIIESDRNKGLADSIIEGVTEVVNKHEKIIILEDDIVTSIGFLKYMNDGLVLYEKEEKVFHISGYMYPHNKSLPDTFFFNVPLCWGWATWKRAWLSYTTNTNQLITYFDSSGKWPEFNKFGGTFLEDQLRANNNGKLNTWFIKWHASIMIKEGFCLFPKISLVNNIGFDSSGVHNGTTKSYMHHSLANSILVKTEPLKQSLSAEKIIKSFYLKLFHNKVAGNSQLLIKRNLKNIIPFKKQIKRIINKIILASIPEIWILRDRNNNWNLLKSFNSSANTGKELKIHEPYNLINVSIGDYTYIAQNSMISQTIIGKFCSVGPNLLCGWGIHPTHGLSTSPMFYSTLMQNGITLSEKDKTEERKLISIGNDVFIGANVTILDGISIGDGAVIGAGAVVSKNIPPYAIAVGNPIQIIRYRFQEEQIKSLLKIKWWDFKAEELTNIEKNFFNIEEFINKYKDI